jgi:hypothetical protein
MIEQLKDELESLENVTGVSMSDLVAFPENLRQVLNWMIRKKIFQVEDLEKFIASEEYAARALVEDMMRKGLLEEIGNQEDEQFRVQMKASRNYRVPSNIWQALEE